LQRKLHSNLHSVGDLLARWFNDNLKSTEHRVVDPAPVPDLVSGQIPEILPARYAIAWFGHPNRDALVEPLEECCSAENPKKYGPVYAGRHVVERLAFLHKTGSNTATWDDDMQRKDGNAALPREQKIAIGATA
jgi:isopenicillin N synthase-like dioxygenase